jgi:hypothetical protein
MEGPDVVRFRSFLLAAGRGIVEAVEICPGDMDGDISPG